MSCPCAGCGKMVFPAEKQVLNGKAFHKNQGCAKCAICGTGLTTKNFISVSGDDKNLWLCNAHGVATTTQAAAFIVKKAKPTLQTHSGSSSNVRKTTNGSEKPKDRLAAFIKRAIQEGESRRLRSYGAASALRKSLRKRATKEALTEWSATKQAEIAVLVEDLRHEQMGSNSNMESENPLFASHSVGTLPPMKKPSSESTTSSGSTHPVEQGTGTFSRLVNSIRFKKPISPAAVPSYSNSGAKVPSNVSSGTSYQTGKKFGGGRKGLVSVSLQNIRIKDRVNVFQRG